MRAAAHLRRRLLATGDTERRQVTVTDLAGFAQTFVDLGDPKVMSRAWR